MKNRLTLTSCRYTRDWEKTLTFTGTIWCPSPSWGWRYSQQAATERQAHGCHYKSSPCQLCKRQLIWKRCIRAGLGKYAFPSCLAARISAGVMLLKCEKDG